MTISAPYSFAFQAQELPRKLSQVSTASLTGYWLCEFSATHRQHQPNLLYLLLSDGKIIFSGEHQLSWKNILHALQRYIMRLRSEKAKVALLTLEQQLLLKEQEQSTASHVQPLEELSKLDLINPHEVTQALRLKILSDLDHSLFNSASGYAQFLPSSQPVIHPLLPSFELKQLISEARKRQVLWHKLKQQIPSMNSVPVLNMEVVLQSDLSQEQIQRLESLIMGNKTLNQISVALAQDPLEIAKGFAQLISKSFVTLQAPAPIAPEIVIIDDSVLILKQFRGLVTSWGYAVKLFQNPAIALQNLQHSTPAIIFLDINMPEINGFDLVKQIRRQPGLAAVPLVMLTAEKTLSNNWRSRWSGCRFLSKPLHPREVPAFQMELRMLLEDMVTSPVTSV
jgi:CheY-like chemotaxis protein